MLLTYISKNLSFKIVTWSAKHPVKRGEMSAVAALHCSMPYSEAYRMLEKPHTHAANCAIRPISVSNVIFALYAAVYQKDTVYLDTVYALCVKRQSKLQSYE